VDWDEDGLTDLITGGRDGKVRIYLNTGIMGDPQFSGYTCVQMAGSDFDVGDTAFPAIRDWNNDGKKDLLAGEDGGRVLLMINEGTNAAPLFNSSSFVKDGSGDLKVSMRSNPVVADWNRDGKKDLIVGEEFGFIYFFENRGSDAAPLFSGGVKLQAGGQDIDVDSRARPDVTDWDGDGVLDILCGQDVWTPSHDVAGVFFFHALGPLSLSANTLSVSAGGQINFQLDAGSAFGGRQYFLLASASGTQPGTTLPGGATLPLNRDMVTDYIVRNYNSGMLIHFRGLLDGSGEAQARLAVPFVPLTAGSILHFAYTTENPYDFQSNAAAVEVLN